VNDHLVTTTRTAAGAPVPAHAKTDPNRVGNNARLNKRRGAPAMKPIQLSVHSLVLANPWQDLVLAD